MRTQFKRRLKIQFGGFNFFLKKTVFGGKTMRDKKITFS